MVIYPLPPVPILPTHFNMAVNCRTAFLEDKINGELLLEINIVVSWEIGVDNMKVLLCIVALVREARRMLEPASLWISNVTFI